MVTIGKVPCRLVCFRGVLQPPAHNLQAAVRRQSRPTLRRWRWTMDCPRRRLPDHHVERPGTEEFQNDSFTHRLGLLGLRQWRRFSGRPSSWHHADDANVWPQAGRQQVTRFGCFGVDSGSEEWEVTCGQPPATSRNSALSSRNSGYDLDFAASASAIFRMWVWKSSSSPSSNSGRASRKSFRRHHSRM
jgi:hypothetical protein